jgi:hypothetical protein
MVYSMMSHRYGGTNISEYKIKRWGSSEMAISKTKSEVKGKGAV